MKLKNSLLSFIKTYSNHIIFTASVLGSLISGYLWYMFGYESSVVCSISGCDHVLTSPYSFFLGIPISAYGFVYFFMLVVIATLRFSQQNNLLKLMRDLSTLIGFIFILYLRYLEFFKIGMICVWCWGVASLVIIIGIVVLVERKASHE